METKARVLFEEAQKKIEQANDELFKPEEDVVSYLVCKNAQIAIENYLKGYLFKNGIDPSSYKTIDSLYQECKSLNKNFEKVDLSNFTCKYEQHTTRDCNEISKVGDCFEIAAKVDDFFRQQKIIS